MKKRPTNVPSFVPPFKTREAVLLPTITSLSRVASSSSSLSKTRHATTTTTRNTVIALSSSLAAAPTSTTTGSMLIRLSESSTDTTTAGAAAPAIVFEPILPSTETLLGMGFIVTLCIIVAYVWQTQVVPTSRTNLALSKRKGPVKEYLDELKQSATTSVVEKSFNSNNSTMELDVPVLLAMDTLRSRLEQETENATSTKTEYKEDSTTMTRDSSSSSSSSSRDFERWLFTDWLQDNKSSAPRKQAGGGRQKPAALPILKDAKWNSGDNPVLAATLLISAGVVLTAVTEKVSQFVFDIMT